MEDFKGNEITNNKSLFTCSSVICAKCTSSAVGPVRRMRAEHSGIASFSFVRSLTISEFLTNSLPNSGCFPSQKVLNSDTTLAESAPNVRKSIRKSIFRAHSSIKNLKKDGNMWYVPFDSNRLTLSLCE